jgi:hypothetical protein
MTLTPQVLASTGEVAGATNWTVTFKDAAGTTVSKTFAVSYTPPAAVIAVSAISPTTFTSATVPYNATISVSGGNLTNVNRIDYSWTGASTGSSSWLKGDAKWNAGVSGITATSMTLTPQVLASTGEVAGATNWTVTFKDAAGTTVSKTFRVTKL